jgi:apolipoprotein N-acyltransferase
MNGSWHRYGARCAGAGAAGILLAAAFPKPSLAALAWIAPGLILGAASGFSGRRAFAIGYAGGLAFWLASLYWILLIPFPGGPIAGWLALSAYCALYPATWVWLCGFWRERLAASRPLFPAREGAPGAAIAPTGGQSGVLWPLFCAAVWVGLEMIRARLFSGFPWNTLGVSQYEMLPLIQMAAWTGVYGLSFLIVWGSVSLWMAVRALLNQPTDRYAWMGPMALPLMAFVGATAFGVARLPPPGKTARELKVALVQPSFPQTLIWDSNENTNRLQNLLRLSEQALAEKPQLLIWPEAAVPDGDDDFEAWVRRSITNLVRRHKVWMIFGANDYQSRAPAQGARDYDAYNASILVDPAGRFCATYRKQKLVIFGEYIPLARWLPFLKWFTPIGEGFSEGKGPVPFRLRDLPATTSVLICFEDVFPHVARHYAEPDTDFLVNITNDGWFRESAAHWQQAASAVFRAVETGTPLVRCANNGMTCWIDGQGRIRELLSSETRGIYGEGIKLARIPLLAEGETRAPTFYRRYGDLFGWICVGVFGLGLIGIRWGQAKPALTSAELTR